MLRYLARRSLYTLLVLVVSSVGVFYALRLAAGDPSTVVINPLALEEVREAYRQRLGLHKPIYVQYFIYLRHMVRGNLGHSLFNGAPIVELLAHHGRNSLVLGVAAFLVSYAIAIPLGMVAAARRNTWADHSATVVTVLGMGIPNFWLALILVYIFSFQYRLLPPAGCCGIKHLILPTVVLAAEGTAVVMRMMRSSMLEQLRQDFVRTARAKGLKEWKVLRDHVFRNALLPIVSLSGLRIGQLIGYTLIVETVFRWPGVGYLLVESVIRRDYPVAQFFSLLLILMVVIGNWGADLVYGLVNPRIRHAT